MSQFTRWLDRGGQQDRNAVRSAVARYGQAVDLLAYGVISPTNISALATAASALQAAAKQAQANPPPACLPDLRHSYVAALEDFNRAAQGARDAAHALLNGDTQRADSDARASTSALDAGAQAMRQATRDLSRLEASR